MSDPGVFGPGDSEKLAREYQHRLRNLLAVIRSIVRRTAETSDGIERFATFLDGRIGAIARVQSALSRVPDGTVMLHSLLADELLTHVAREGKQVGLQGPPVGLRGKPAEALALAIHELAVNAVVHGALSAPGGRIHARWTVEPSRDLLFDWKESGPKPRPAEFRGFGREMLEQTLAYELQADARLAVEADGIRWEIRIPAHPDIIPAPV